MNEKLLDALILAESSSSKLDDAVSTSSSETASCFDNLEKSKSPKGAQTLEEMFEEMSTHPAFLTEIDYTKPLHPATEALIALQYETDDAQDKADKYKDDGNDNFKRKRYSWAIDNYTAALRARCSDPRTNAVIHSNRAAAHYHLGNYRSSLNDAIEAQRICPDHMKALVRGAKCCFKLKLWDECEKWCEEVLSIDNDCSEIQKMKVLVQKEKITHRENLKRDTFKLQNDLEQDARLLSAINKRNISLKAIEGQDTKGYDLLTCQHRSGEKVHYEEDGSLTWPVMFLYPEFSESDFIQAVNENDSLMSHLEVMFGADSPPAPWDIHANYTPDTIEMFFMESDTGQLRHVDKSSTLLKILQNKRYTVSAGTPIFILLSTASDFYETYRKRHNMCR